MEEKSAGFVEFLCAGALAGLSRVWQWRPGAFDLRGTDTTTPLGCGAGCSIYNLVRVFD
jgi:hypothetical protein